MSPCGDDGTGEPVPSRRMDSGALSCLQAGEVTELRGVHVPPLGSWNHSQDWEELAWGRRE